MGEALRVLVIGAHPDDGEFKVGGCAALWTAAGHVVRFVSATNGDAGHQTQGGPELAERREAEAAAAAKILGAEARVLPIGDGRLLPTLENRLAFIREIRRFAPDLVITHRPNDYHPDHRYTSLLVQDSAYLVTVPNVAPDTPPLKANPVICYCCDDFRKPIPFAADVAIDIDAAVDRKLDSLDAHVSQMYEWLPFSRNGLAEVPADPAERRARLFERYSVQDREVADRFREQLIGRYGPKRGSAVRHAEAFEACEYGAPLTAERIERLFGGM